MKAKIIVPFSILLALVLMAVTVPYALGCQPDGMNPSQCVRLPDPPPADPPTAVPVAAITVPLFGTNPNNAVVPMGTWVSINPNETHWYKMDDSGMELRIWVDANGQGRNGLGLAIFAPDQHDLYGKPVGRGSFNPGLPAHDLFWDGYTVANGVWYAQVTNLTKTPISYNLNYEHVINSVAAGCSLCHGYNISDWGRCQDRGNNLCQGLQGNYKK